MINPLPLARMLAFCGLCMATGCAEQASTRYPSLLPRAIESRSDAEPVIAVPVAAPDPALDAQVASSVTALKANMADFAIAATKAGAAAKLARGDAVGGERWLDAQTALAELDVYRAQSSGIVTDLEEASLGRAADGKPPYPALETARAAAQTELDAETARIAALQAALPDA